MAVEGGEVQRRPASLALLVHKLLLRLGVIRVKVIVQQVLQAVRAVLRRTDMQNRPAGGGKARRCNGHKKGMLTAEGGMLQYSLVSERSGSVTGVVTLK